MFKKRSPLIILIVLFLACVLTRPPLTEAGWRDWKVEGFVEGSFYQPHGRFEPYPGVFENDRAIGRMGLETSLEIRQSYIPRLFIYADFLFHLGNRQPRFDYHWTMETITLKRRWGVGLTLFHKPNLELRVTHSNWDDLLGKVGISQIWNAAQIRWNYDFSQGDKEGFRWRLKGWLEGSFYPDHNEYDPNLKIRFAERVVARYGLEGSSELRQGRFPNLVLFFNFFACFGDSRPQIDYNYRADPIGMEINFGLGWVLGKKRNMQIRLTHDRWIDLGGMRVDRVAWTALQFRWNFGYPEGSSG